MNGPSGFDTIWAHLHSGKGLALFLDYDGTLIPIGRAPSETQTDTALIDLLTRVASRPNVQANILSARSLSSLLPLLSIPRLTVAGVYGLEIQIEGKRVARGAPLALVRPILARVISEWEETIKGRPGFLIEDKGYTVALHASAASAPEADRVVTTARVALADWLPAKDFRVLGARDYLEVAPVMANKGQTVDWLLDQSHRPDQLPVYFGDDQNDDEAFAVVQRRGGIAIGVGSRYAFAHATAHVDSPAEVREWLQKLLEV